MEKSRTQSKGTVVQAIVIPAILFVVGDKKAMLYEREDGCGALLIEMLYDGALPIMELEE